ncbi:MAG TPA: ArsA family ATPase [Bryobacteraceae bacterium]|jgi:arsenite-transporting ATPase
MSRPMPSFFDRPGPELLLFGGKGGVGKTTCATAAALRMSALAPQRSLLLVSTDPAHSIRDSLAGYAPLGNLEVLELDAPQYLVKFRKQNGAMLREIAAAGTFLDDEDINRFLNLSLPGLDELMAFLEISSWVEACRYDRIVVDTAPSGHTLRLLAIPELIRRWLDMLEVLLAKRRYMRRVFSRDASPDRLDLFVTGWKSSLLRTEKLLHDPARTEFVPVTIAEPLSVHETLALFQELLGRKMPVSELIVNQLHLECDCPACAAAGSAEQTEIQRLLAGVESPCSAWGIPLLAEEVRGLELLSGFWDHARPVAQRPVGAARHGLSYQPAVLRPAARPSPRMQFVLLAGKGGVGKTTLSCATAIRLAREFPEKRVLLFSTDPAHSLSACLQTQIGSRPAVVFPGLTAMEIDAKAEFEKLKTRYADDLERFLQSVSRGFDLTFDRVVLERMLDLSPPGLDEVMALTRILEFLAQRRYDLFVLDCASTGHLIRLLELPELINEWLKAFFSLFLKYERILRLPGFTDELVGISRNLKKLREVLRNPAASALFAVSIPTQMAREETRDLVAACHRMGISVPLVFLNLVTPPCGCHLCASLQRRERLVLEGFRQAFPEKPQALVYRQQEIAGLERLERLGQSLYQPAIPELATAELAVPELVIPELVSL